MIKLITKERYYKLLGVNDCKDYHQYTVRDLSKDRWNKFGIDNNLPCVHFYLEEEKVCFVYINFTKTLLIPKIYKDPDEIYKLILLSDTTLDNWKLELLEKVDWNKHREYLLNTFKYGNFSRSLIMNNEKIVYTSGKYIIRNIDFLEDFIEFSLTNDLYDPYCYWKSTYIAYPKKAELIISDNNKLNYIESFVAIILNEHGGDYTEFNIKGK